jgi:hypothetical protein
MREIVAFAAALMLAGCASPGPPLPPTLNLPQVVSASGLTATRVGDEVRLHWTTPTQTTDKLPIKGPITAEVCRESILPSPAKASNSCPAVTRVQVTSGPSDAIDRLPPQLTIGPAWVLVYRVQLLNKAGRTAGPSPAVLAAAGAAPDPVADFAGSVTREGVVLRWRPESDAGGSKETVELDRTTLDAAAAASSSRSNALPGTEKHSAQARFRAGESTATTDVGGTLDRTAEIGHSYGYTAQRVDVAELAGQSLELRSVPTAALAFTVRDEFPPGVPEGLVAVPGAAEGDAETPAVDLSWDPDLDPDAKVRVAGYRVYRRDDGENEWRRIGPDLVTASAYRDPTVAAGHRYAYRVTAVSTTGHESGPSAEAAETAPGT